MGRHCDVPIVVADGRPHYTPRPPMPLKSLLSPRCPLSAAGGSQGSPRPWGSGGTWGAPNVRVSPPPHCFRGRHRHRRPRRPTGSPQLQCDGERQRKQRRPSRVQQRQQDVVGAAQWGQRLGAVREAPGVQQSPTRGGRRHRAVVAREAPPPTLVVPPQSYADGDGGRGGAVFGAGGGRGVR